eukprot:gene13280-17645_t
MLVCGLSNCGLLSDFHDSFVISSCVDRPHRALFKFRLTSRSVTHTGKITPRKEIRTPTSGWRNAPAMRALAVAMALATAAGPAAMAPAQAQNATRGMPIVRDTEIEQLLRDYASPILKAAGLAKQNVKVVVLNDRAFNAFVMDGRHIFINAGALFDAKTPNEVIGVFAHETGHLAGGHLLKLREQLASAQTASIVALLLGVGAAVAGSRSAGGGGDVGA